MSKAVFLDRDGVLNEMYYSKDRKEFHPPYDAADVKLFDGVLESLKVLRKNDYLLFMITNQPDHAKGKATLEKLMDVREEFQRIFSENDIRFSGQYYCFHHPEGIVAEFSGHCDCRKPGNYFVIEAVNDFDVDVRSSWFIGDRDKDIICGTNSGLRTIRIKSNYYEYKNKTDADFVVNDLKEATEIILTNK
ncbi:MAG TPA: HAD-IIIA family hydrolase [Ignavibacteria bacterium]|nr:HAD-IIIA family hydrolase [Ignavibacteria bacterium]HMR40221.1 HAD-IIIA family hydrolase [Ignavibacteria bacterium]